MHSVDTHPSPPPNPPAHHHQQHEEMLSAPPDSGSLQALCVHLGKLKREDQEAPNLRGGGQWITNEPISVFWLNTWSAGDTGTQLCP